MRICVITGGPNICELAADIALSCDKVLCADSGADFAFEHHLMPECIYGDLDSISEEGKLRINSLGIPVEIFPAEKDMTDTELVLSRISVDDEIILVCSLEGRIDHVMANLQIVMKMREVGYQITATDGLTDVIPMCSGDNVTIDELVNTEDAVISLIPDGTNAVVKNVVTSGLYYPINNVDIVGGSSFTVSNKLANGSTGFSVSIGEGNLFLVVTNKLL